MKFRNITTLLFTVSVFSSAYSMSDGRRSPLSQEVDPDTGARINYISPCIFSSEVLYKKINNKINRWNFLLEGYFKSFYKHESILSPCEFEKYKNHRYEHSVSLIIHILELRDNINNDYNSMLADELVNKLIDSLDDVEKKLNSLLNLYF